MGVLALRDGYPVIILNYENISMICGQYNINKGKKKIKRPYGYFTLLLVIYYYYHHHHHDFYLCLKSVCFVAFNITHLKNKAKMPVHTSQKRTLQSMCFGDILKVAQRHLNG